MKGTKTYAALLVCLGMAGCATMQHEIESGQATLIPQTVDVEPWGTNYKISGLVGASQQRTKVDVYASDCSKGGGSLSSDSYDDIFVLDNLLVNGPSHADKLYTALCVAGMPTAFRMDRSVTPAQRAAQRRAVANALILESEIEQQQAAEQRHDQAVRDAGQAVGDAISNLGKQQREHQQIECDGTGNGFTCQSQ